MAKKQALGRGLGALLKDDIKNINDSSDVNADKLIGNIAEVDISSIKTNPFQPRTKFDEESVQELSISIKELGLIQPITVRKLDDGNFQLISGERRFRASKLAGLKTLPAYIRIANDQESLEMALVENIQRQDLDAIEIALSYQRLIDECNLTQETMSTRVGKKRSTITNYLRLLKLDPIIQTGVRDKIISMGHARALINIDDLESQLDIYEDTVKKQLSVRQTEKMVRDFKSGTTTTENKNPDKLPESISSQIDKISRILNNKINVKVNSKGGGKIIISFKSNEDFKNITNYFEK